jgi:hypothetical protein
LLTSRQTFRDKGEVMSEMPELTDTEIGAVCAGIFDFGNIIKE